jgi:hypothetical protein
LSAGTQYIFETRDLRAGWFFTPDTYMYLVRGNTIVARNDDHYGLASLIAYQPSVSGSYLLVIRAYSKYNAGTCDVYQTTGGGSPQKIDNDVRFGGYPISAHWKGDERIETRNATGDTYLFLVHGNTMLRNDDGGAGLHSRITPGYEGYGQAYVGSYSRYSEGETWLCNYYQSYLDNPGERDEIDDPAIVVTDAMARFQAEMRKHKASLEELSPEELAEQSVQAEEERIQKIRDSILDTDDVKRLGAPAVSVPREFIAASQQYDELLRGEEKGLAALPVAERGQEMRKMEVRKREMLRAFVPQEEY